MIASGDNRFVLIGNSSVEDKYVMSTPQSRFIQQHYLRRIESST